MLRINLKVKHSGTDMLGWLNRMSKRDYLNELDKCGQIGVESLRDNTPVRTGLTAASWSYKVETSGHTVRIIWSNSNVTRAGQPIAIMLQYGHGTGTGGYVVGRDYINPAMKPVFDEIERRVWKVVTANE